MGRGPRRIPGRPDRRGLDHPQPRERRQDQIVVGEGYAGVCQKPYQFSCWNKSDPNFAYLSGAKKIPFRELAQARIAADQVVDGKVSDPTGGATHYYATTMPKPPTWVKGAKQTLALGHHAFFKDVP